jgi:large subunit ribosomal protein LX
MFKVSGEYRKKKKTYSFTKTVNAKSKVEARERAYSLIGSDHKVKRHLITIKEVTKT